MAVPELGRRCHLGPKLPFFYFWVPAYASAQVQTGFDPLHMLTWDDDLVLTWI